ncbi:MAG: sigma-54 dependent transcriptional regulator [Thermodesulfobacteriota bacterium]
MAPGTYPPHPILLVDDEAHTLASFDIALRSNGLTNILRCQDSREVETLLKAHEVEVLLLDLMMPHRSGQEILAQASRDYPDLPVIIVTGVNDVGTAVQCIQRGAFDYVLKPVEAERLLPSIGRALEIRRLRRENSELSNRFLADTLAHPEAFAAIVTGHPKMQAVFRYCEAVASGQQPVLISGETGVGKELIAKALHDLSSRSGQFVAVNVAGLDDQVFSDTLFGHAKGAFTGADRPRPGLVEKAAGGTLFLDEIGDLSHTSQVKLLRFLEAREYYPLGSDLARRSDARVLVATHKEVENLQREGAFRKDLYYRLRTHHVHIPPLRERREDISLLLERFLDEAAREFGKKKPTYHRELVTLLKGYHFPGNVRELKAMVFDAVSNHTSRMLGAEAFRTLMASERQAAASVADSSPEQPGNGEWAASLDRLPTLKEATRILVHEALRRSDNNQRVAAHMLGITPQALNQRLKRQ